MGNLKGIFQLVNRNNLLSCTCSMFLRKSSAQDPIFWLKLFINGEILNRNILCLQNVLNSDCIAWSISTRIHYLFSFCHCNLLNPRVLRHKQQQTLHPRRGGKDLEELSATKTQSHLSGSDRSLRHRPLHRVPQRTGRHCTRALHLIVHSYGRVIMSQQASVMSPT